MKDINWKELIGKRIIIRTDPHTYEEKIVNEVSPSSQFIKLNNTWHYKLEITLEDIL